MTATTAMHVIVRHGDDEKCVNTEVVNCTCDTFKTLKVCCHIILAMKTRSGETVDKYIDSLGTHSAVPVPGLPNSGSKPGSKNRKGGRTTKIHAKKTAVDTIKGCYIVVRRSNRQKVCNGCKAPLDGSTHVIRHYCALPYPFKSHITGQIETRIGTPSNHYFHLRKWCVLRSSYHKEFSGKVQLDPTVTATHRLKIDKAESELAVQ